MHEGPIQPEAVMPPVEVGEILVDQSRLDPGHLDIRRAPVEVLRIDRTANLAVVVRAAVARRDRDGASEIGAGLLEKLQGLPVDCIAPALTITGEIPCG